MTYDNIDIENLQCNSVAMYIVWGLLRLAPILWHTVTSLIPRLLLYRKTGREPGKTAP